MNCLKRDNRFVVNRNHNNIKSQEKGEKNKAKDSTFEVFLGKIFTVSVRYYTIIDTAK